MSRMPHWGLVCKPACTRLTLHIISGCCVLAQVTVLPLALGRQACSKQQFTFYPAMPGNSTAHPLEKRQLQADCMEAFRFQSAQLFDCQVETLSHVMQQQGLHHIDLLKVWGPTCLCLGASSQPHGPILWAAALQIDAEGAELDILLGVCEADWHHIRQAGCSQGWKPKTVPKDSMQMPTCCRAGCCGGA